MVGEEAFKGGRGGGHSWVIGEGAINGGRGHLVERGRGPLMWRGEGH